MFYRKDAKPLFCKLPINYKQVSSEMSLITNTQNKYGNTFLII